MAVLILGGDLASYANRMKCEGFTVTEKLYVGGLLEELKGKNSYTHLVIGNGIWDIPKSLRGKNIPIGIKELCEEGGHKLKVCLITSADHYYTDAYYNGKGIDVINVEDDDAEQQLLNFVKNK